MLAALLVLFPGSASAQGGLVEGLRVILDTNVSTMSTTTTDGTGRVTKTTTDSLFPRLTINADALVYPNLRLNLGGVFDVDLSSSTINAADTNSTLTRLRPFFELRSTNPTLSPGIGYFRRVNRASVGGLPAFTLVGEDYAAYLGWRPEGLPLADFQFVRTNTFDGDRIAEDATKDFGSILSRYTKRGLTASYHGSYLATTDRINGVETRQVTNSGRFDHSTTFFAKRLRWNTTYNVNHQDLKTASSGDGGEVAFPVIPFAGLAVISDTPLTAVLTPNPLLIDANLTASAGIDLGTSEPGLASQARNIGLDFLTPAEVNRLLVWVDRELPAEIANSFSWEVYGSPDNITWTRHTTVSTASFGPFENRFVLDFRSLTARYIKVVTRPLSAALPEASRFPDIFVTELQPFVTSSAGDARGRLKRTSQVLNTDVRMRIVNALYYEGSYWYTDVSSASHRDTLSNGLSVNQALGRMFTVYGRGAHERGDQFEGYRVANVGNASLTFTPIRTLRSSLLYTGQDERIDDLRNDRQNVVVQTNAQLYRGVDVQFGFGWNFASRETGEHLRDRLLNVSASVMPRDNLNLTLNYVDTTTRRSGRFTGNPEYHTRRGYLTLAVDPLRTLHLVLGEEVVAVTDEKTRLTHNIGVNWAPFPDGSLQVIVAYNEALRDLVFGTERIFQQSVRWTFARQSFIEVSYQRIASESLVDTTRSKVLGANLKLFF